MNEPAVHPILRRAVMANQLSWELLSDALKDVAAEVSHSDPEMANVLIWLQRACYERGKGES